MDEANRVNRLDDALNGMNNAKLTEHGFTGIAGGMGQCSGSAAPAYPPSAKQLLYEAAHRHQEKAEGLRTLARLLPDAETLNYDARRTLQAAIEGLLSSR